MKKIFIRPKTPIWIYIIVVMFFSASLYAYWIERHFASCESFPYGCESGFWVYLISGICMNLIFVLVLIGMIWRDVGLKGNRFVITSNSITMPGNGFLKAKQEVTIKKNDIIGIELLEPKGKSIHYVINIVHANGLYEIVFFPHEKDIFYTILKEIKI